MENPFVNKLIHEELEKGTGPRKFSYRELVRATSNFEEGENLGEGGFGGVYRGFIKDLNSYVANGNSVLHGDIKSSNVMLDSNFNVKLGDFGLQEKTDRFQLRKFDEKWVWELYGEGKVIQAADPKLNGEFDEKSMECVLIVGLWCAHPDYKFRPSIQQAIQVLNLEVPLPILPSKMPVAAYFAPPRLLSTLLSETISSERGQTES
ncbi:PREDICTED: L-type lectin-domain [Prunus dulcis]|uniref:PREDICTED: L-type lectin-domain n=1 Tax=Prunus dulcis TaxID=3755 RepID=A0A5E4ELU8_PRUDU|nr:PREDICTED: L-type lectin-domain [Prunus dulcis]